MERWLNEHLPARPMPLFEDAKYEGRVDLYEHPVHY